MDNEAAEKHKLFLEEVKIMRLVYEEKAREQATQDKVIAKTKAEEREEWLNEHKIFKTVPEDITLEELKRLALQRANDNQSSRFILMRV